MNIQYIKGENFGVKDDSGDITIDFDCGIVNAEGYFDDCNDDYIPLLEKIFKDNNIECEIGAAECYHIIDTQGEAPNSIWQRVTDLFKANGITLFNK